MNKKACFAIAFVVAGGIANLTKSESMMLVHCSKDRSQHYSLIRIKEPEKTEATR
jgi:hypothetical protein